MTRTVGMQRVEAQAGEREGVIGKNRSSFRAPAPAGRRVIAKWGHRAEDDDTVTVIILI